MNHSPLCSTTTTRYLYSRLLPQDKEWDKEAKRADKATAVEAQAAARMVARNVATMATAR